MDPSSPFRVRFPSNFMVVMLTWVLLKRELIDRSRKGFLTTC